MQRAVVLSKTFAEKQDRKDISLPQLFEKESLMRQGQKRRCNMVVKQQTDYKYIVSFGSFRPHQQHSLMS